MEAAGSFMHTVGHVRVPPLPVIPGIPDTVGHVRPSRPAMIPGYVWLLATTLVFVAGVVAFVPVASLRIRPFSLPRQIVEVFIVTLAVIALVGLGRVALWLIEHRW